MKAMRMKNIDIQNYPKLAQWVRMELPLLPRQKKKVWKAFEEHSPQSMIKIGGLSLSWGLPPKLEVYPRRCEQFDEPRGNYIYRTYDMELGKTIVPANLIIIAEDIASRFDRRDADMVTIVEATILHELIHWLRGRAGLDIMDEELSYAFEKAAYGRSIGRKWRMCPDPKFLGPFPPARPPMGPPAPARPPAERRPSARRPRGRQPAGWNPILGPPA
jgi:hypothetical protein